LELYPQTLCALGRFIFAGHPGSASGRNMKNQRTVMQECVKPASSFGQSASGRNMKNQRTVMQECVKPASSFGQNPSHTPAIIAIHVLCWIAQFVGHGLAEKRAPALLDNLLGGKNIPDNPSPVVDVLPFALLAVVLAPFFVHLEILFGLGYRPAMHKRINNAIGKEITRIRKEEGDRRRKAQ
jgi:hypothetical protein